MALIAAKDHEPGQIHSVVVEVTTKDQLPGRDIDIGWKGNR